MKRKGFDLVVGGYRIPWWAIAGVVLVAVLTVPGAAAGGVSVGPGPAVGTPAGAFVPIAGPSARTYPQWGPSGR